MTERTVPQESKVEVTKREGRYLRGTIRETLAAEDATHFGPDDVQLLKFHGTYQQDDRDARRHREGGEKAWRFMVRVVLPGGVLTADQYLGFDELAERYADGTLRVTTRQGFQFHGVLKGTLKPTIAGINHRLATTIAACGDVQRNVMGCPASLDDAAHATVQRTALALAEALRPRSGAYHEIWLDSERQVSTEDEEPFYGTQYLPRKFKTAVGLSTDNCVDVYAQDVALLGVVEHGAVRGFNLLVGGGLGMTHHKGDTFAHLAEPLAFVPVDRAVEAVRAVAAIYRDHGNRADRKHARLKYLLADWGIERFREEFDRRVGFPVVPPAAVPRPPFHDHLGRHRQADGRWLYGIFIQSGRIADTAERRLRSALREIVTRWRPGLRLTAHQNLLLTDLDLRTIDPIEDVLRAHGITPAPELSAVRRFSMACPALPTCGLAVAESERALPALLAELEQELEALGLSGEPITVRMTGCPNGCARPYTADVAFVGRSLDLYHVYVGGGLAGDRLTELYLADVPRSELIAALRPLLARWAAERTAGEGLGDFYQRLLDRPEPRLTLTGRETPTAAPLGLEVGR